MSSALELLVTLTTLIGLAQIHALAPTGRHVCSHECHSLEWETTKVTRACGYPLFEHTCTVSVRRPNIKKATCYECCAGWRQSGDNDCDAECKTGSAGITDCTDLPDGWYQLCDACAEFAQCDAGALQRMPCPKRRHWDDYSKKCVKHSQTCETGKGDKARFNVEDEKPTETVRDEANELTNQIGIDLGTDVDTDEQTCGEISCDAPGRCLMMFAEDTYRPAPRCICPSGMRLSVSSPGQCESINECDSDPCLHGRCIDRMFGYRCRCEREWRGRHCNKPRRRNRKSRQRDRADQVRTEVHYDRNREDDDDDMSWDI